MASWFQDEHHFHEALVRDYIDKLPQQDNSYGAAKALVVQLMPRIIPAVKEIRLSGIRLPDITAGDLIAKLPGADPDVVEKLCARFT